jgi:hypothetical protein
MKYHRYFLVSEINQAHISSRRELELFGESPSDDVLPQTGARGRGRNETHGMELRPLASETPETEHWSAYVARTVRLRPPVSS